MNLKKCMGAVMCAAVLFTGCGMSNDDVELTDEEKEWNAIKSWFELEIINEDKFTDLADYQHYARTIGLEKDGLLDPTMWEFYYSDSVNINKDIDGTAVYVMRLNPDKLLEVWAANNETTAEDICDMLGTTRDDLYYNFGYTANSIDYTKNHKDSKVSYPELENNIFGADNGENRQVVFGTHFLRVTTGSKYRVKYASTDENMEIKQRDLLKATTKVKTYDVIDYTDDETKSAFKVNDVDIRRFLLLDIPNGWSNALIERPTLMFNDSPYSYGCTDEDLVDIFADEVTESEDDPLDHVESEGE